MEEPGIDETIPNILFQKLRVVCMHRKSMLNSSNSKVIIRRVTENGGWWETNFRFRVRRNGSGDG